MLADALAAAGSPARSRVEAAMVLRVHPPIACLEDLHPSGFVLPSDVSTSLFSAGKGKGRK